MNSLSWFLYLAELIGNLRGGLVLLAFIIVAVMGGGLLAGVAAKERARNYDDPSWILGSKMQTKAVKSGVAALVAIVLFGIMLPSKTTMYLIIASEMGEDIIKDPEVKLLMQDVKTYIRDSLKPDFIGGVKIK